MKSPRIVSVFVIVLLLLLTIPYSALAASPVNSVNVTDRNSGNILVKFRTGIMASEISQIHRQYGGQLKKTIPAIGVQVVSVPSDQVLQKAEAYSSNPKVAYAEPDYMAQVTGNPDDPYLGYQWGLIKIGAPEAWGITTGSVDVKIAILDTGIDLNHPDLEGKIVANANFTNSLSADDAYGHGTHVAGIAAASTNNGVGVAGLGYSSSILNVKVLGDDGYGSYSSIAQGIIWASDNGARVINMSLGGAVASAGLQDAVNYAWSKGVTLVAAAGNKGSSSPFYPAYYANVIAVAATDTNDNLPSWSNYGEWVDVAAPGASIYSTLMNAGYGYKSGTSMASPYTSGLAALIYTVVTDSNGNGRLNDEVRSRIETTTDRLSSTGTGSGRINAYKAVSNLAPAPAPTPLTGSLTGTVTDSSDGSRIAGATIRGGTWSALTAAQGEYTISNIPEGSYAIVALATGYSNVSRVVSVRAGQTTQADFAMTRLEPPALRLMWVDNIIFIVNGKNLSIEVKVVGDTGAVPGASVGIQVTRDGAQTYQFSGVTDSYGKARFKILKAPSGDYKAVVTAVTASGYTWNTASGITSASHAISSVGSQPTRE